MSELQHSDALGDLSRTLRRLRLHPTVLRGIAVPDLRRSLAAALSVVALTGCGTTGSTGAGPASPQLVREALVSRDGRTLIVPGRFGACETDVSATVAATTPDVRILRTAHEPSGDLACLPVDLQLSRTAVTLAAPLGSRRLIDASTDKPIPYVSEQMLAQPGYLPGNVTPALDLPLNGWTRVYGFPTRDHHAPLFITQTPWPPMPDLSKDVGDVIQHVDINGHPGFLIDGRGPAASTDVWWKQDGFTFIVSSAPAASYQRAIPTAKVLEVARGLAMPPS